MSERRTPEPLETGVGPLVARSAPPTKPFDEGRRHHAAQNERRRVRHGTRQQGICQQRPHLIAVEDREGAVETRSRSQAICVGIAHQQQLRVLLLSLC